MEAGQKVKIPANSTLYSEGRTLAYWTDSYGAQYHSGDEITVNSDMMISAYVDENAEFDKYLADFSTESKSNCGEEGFHIDSFGI